MCTEEEEMGEMARGFSEAQMSIKPIQRLLVYCQCCTECGMVSLHSLHSVQQLPLQMRD